MSFNACQKLRVVGTEDGSFQRNSAKTVLAAVLFQDLWVEDIRFTYITVDGFDATEKFTNMLYGWRFDIVLLASLSFGGFNVIDPHEVFRKFHKPVIVVSRRKPDNKAVREALRRHFYDWKRRWKIFRNAAPVYLLGKESTVYVELAGLDVVFAREILDKLTLFGRVPEPIRVARIIARGISSKVNRN
jgi:hypothetical protein